MDCELGGDLLVHPSMDAWPVPRDGNHRLNRKVAPMIWFFVEGLPAPQGSKRHVGNGRMIEASKRVGPWRKQVAAAAAVVMAEEGTKVLAGPVTLEVEFRLPRPKSHFTPKGVLRKSAPRVPHKRPDLDKLVRSIGDALTRVCWGDDGQVASIVTRKVYGDPCAIVRVTPFHEDEEAMSYV